MAKRLRDIAGKGQFSGVRKSTVAPPDIDDKNLYQWNAADGVKFVKKHDTETHEYPYDADVAFKGRKDGGSKTTKYKFQKDGVYEEAEEVDEKYMGFEKLKKSIAAKGGARDPGAVAAAIGRKKYGKEKFQKAAAAGKKLGESSCNHTMEGVMCEVHGESACPTKENDVNMQKTAKKDAKGRQYIADKKIKEETDINEVAPPSPKLEKWIKANKERFIKQYGKEKGTQVLYAKAWKMHGQSESGTATNTDYTGPGAAGWTTGRLDVGTL